MPYSTYRHLPLETLYELLAIASRDMVVAVESKDNREVGIKAMKKQIEILLRVIDEKKVEKTHADGIGLTGI